MAPESVARLLDENAELKPLAARLAYIKSLQRRYRALAPERLAEASRVCAIDGTTVVICAEGSAVAAALRQLAPRLLEGLREAALSYSRRRSSSKHSGVEGITSIRVEVQVAAPSRKRAATHRGEMPAEKLAAVAAGLAESPLKSALEHIATKDKSRKARSRS